MKHFLRFPPASAAPSSATTARSQLPWNLCSQTETITKTHRVCKEDGIQQLAGKENEASKCYIHFLESYKVCPDLELTVLRSNFIFLSFCVFHLVSYTNSMRWTWITHAWRIVKTHIDPPKMWSREKAKGRKDGKEENKEGRGEGREEGRQEGKKPQADNECKAHWLNPMVQVQTSSINSNITFSLWWFIVSHPLFSISLPI